MSRPKGFFDKAIICTGAPDPTPPKHVTVTYDEVDDLYLVSHTREQEMGNPRMVLTLLEEKVRKYETVERGRCRDCGNAWWFSEPNAYVCTTCAKTHGRDTSDVYVPKNVSSPSEDEK